MYFLLKISYSQVVFVLMRLPKVFFLGKFDLKNWGFPNWLKFGTGVHYYMLITILTFVFSKFFSFMYSWANLVSKSEILQIDWNFVQGYSLYAYYDFNVYFFKTFAIHIILGNLVLKSNVLQIDWKLMEGYIVIRWLRLSCVIFCS